MQASRENVVNKADGKEGLVFIVFALAILFLGLFHMWSEAWTMVRTLGTFATYGVASVITLLGAAVTILVLGD